MTTLVEGAKRLMGRRSDLTDRLAALSGAVEATRGRLDDDAVERAAAVVVRAEARLRLSADHTVVALAGATGSGKSSTFNALAGVDLATVGVRRPTTSFATSCVWGDQPAEELLDWLGIPPRHQSQHDSTLSTGRDAAALDGLVLLDLPDHDSTEVKHHLEVERLVGLADLMVWVLDPQKYADAAVHERFLRPFAAHKDVMLVVLNHLDEVAPDRREAMLGDVRRLLDDDGLTGIPLLGTSATRGDGVEELRAAITKRVKDKAAVRTRLSADVSRAAEELAVLNGTAKPHRLGEEDAASLIDALAYAAGVPTVVEAVRASSRARTARATGWPVTAWFSRLRPDPLRRLHLDRKRHGADTADAAVVARSSLPQATALERSRVEAAVRELGERTSHDLTRPWALAVRRASLSRAHDLEDALDRAVSSTDLGMSVVPAWARGLRLVQWTLLLAAVVGLGWLGVLAGFGYFRLPEPPTPEVSGFPLPSLLAVAGIGLGVLLALLSRALVSASANKRARRTDARLREAVAAVTEELVVTPVRAELDAYGVARQRLLDARG